MCEEAGCGSVLGGRVCVWVEAGCGCVRRQGECGRRQGEGVDA